MCRAATVPAPEPHSYLGLAAGIQHHAAWLHRIGLDGSMGQAGQTSTARRDPGVGPRGRRAWQASLSGGLPGAVVQVVGRGHRYASTPVATN